MDPGNSHNFPGPGILLHQEILRIVRIDAYISHPPTPFPGRGATSRRPTHEDTPASEFTVFNKVSIGKRLILGFGLIIVIQAIAVAVAIRGFRSLGTAMAEVNRQAGQIVIAKDAHAHTLSAMTYVGAMAATVDPAVR